jgi:hypothetical protein
MIFQLWQAHMAFRNMTSDKNHRGLALVVKDRSFTSAALAM